MALTPGLSPNLRIVDSSEPVKAPFADQDVDIGPEKGPGDVEIRNSTGDLLKIEHDDGSITINMDGGPLQKAGRKKHGGWWANLVDEIDEHEQSRIAEDLLRGIRDDLSSRQDWVEDRAQGIKLLGLKLDIPGIGGSADGAPVEGISRIRHPLLLEAVLRFQANARAELLPTDGPVKLRDDGNGSTTQQDQLANALQRDMNHYLTSTATEYYPDTDRMLLMLGFGGTMFKKVYFCPLRGRPVSETVDAEDLIVNQSATTLENASRRTHRLTLKGSTVKRMQIIGAYADIPLHTPHAPDLDAVQLEKKAQEGISPDVFNSEERDRDIYECYCELNIKGFEHTLDGEPTELEIPYRVTIDISSRRIFSIVRDYNEDSQDLPVARTTFVKYTFVPGFGFYDIGLLNILGNTTNAITAAWREMLDSGMYANFPGFLFADVGARQNTSIFRVPPGGGAPIKTGGAPIQQAVMPLPYKEPGPAFMSLVENIAQTGMRIGGTSEQQVGEGRSDAPVGTTLALIEQATKILNSVHKRLHAAQAQEFALLLDVFREHPKSFWQNNKRPTYQWDEYVFRSALDDADIVPQADPNTSSYAQRVLKIMALKQLQAAQPALYDPIAIDKAAIVALGFSNPEQFLAPPQAQASPPPELLQAQAQMRQGDVIAGAQKIAADARMMDAQTKAAVAQAKVQGGLAGAEGRGKTTPEEMQVKAADLKLKAAGMSMDAHKSEAESKNRAADRQAKLEIEKMHLIADSMGKIGDRAHAEKLAGLAAGEQRQEHAADLQAQAHEGERQRSHEFATKAMDIAQRRQEAAQAPKAKPGGGE